MLLQFICPPPLFFFPGETHLNILNSWSVRTIWTKINFVGIFLVMSYVVFYSVSSENAVILQTFLGNLLGTFTFLPHTRVSKNTGKVWCCLGICSHKHKEDISNVRL